MNERIKELADKIWEEKYWTNPNTDRLLPAQLNRFAELIVYECMEQVHYTREDMINDNISQVIKDRIEKHFGIEE